MSEYVLKQLYEIHDKNKLDDFLLCNNTNGEFVSTIKYLSYHPKIKFNDDCVCVVDKGNGEIRGVVIAAQNTDDPKTIISHPGTSFAGPIVSSKSSIADIEVIINMLLDYYESKYSRIIIRTRPSYFDYQPAMYVDYFLMRRGYAHSVVGLSNVLNLSEIASDDDIFAVCDCSKRNHIRKVIKSNKFYFEERSEIIPISWNNMSETLRNKHNANIVHSVDEMMLLKSMFPDRISFYYTNTHENDYGAMAVVYKYKNVFHTQYLDTNYKYTGEYPNLLLIFNLIKEAKRLGYNKFSFGISTENSGNELNYGLYNYKSGYGGGAILQVQYVKNLKLMK